MKIFEIYGKSLSPGAQASLPAGRGAFKSLRVKFKLIFGEGFDAAFQAMLPAGDAGARGDENFDLQKICEAL